MSTDFSVEIPVVLDEDEGANGEEPEEVEELQFEPFQPNESIRAPEAEMEDEIIAAKVELVDIDSIFEDPSNARTHPERNLRSIMASLQRWGQQKPIVVAPDNLIIAGNGTHRAMKALGYPRIAIVRSNLSGPDATAYGIADNQIGLTSEWDFQALSEHVKALQDWEHDFDYQTIGFEAHEIDPMIHADWTPPEPKKDGVGDEDELPEMGKPVAFTSDQREIINQGIRQMRKQEGDSSMSEGRCLELICAEFLSGVDPGFMVATDASGNVETPGDEEDYQREE